ncbi:MAG: class I SAM-dependent methyltransferase [Acidimicrobiales bacterium]|nr:class I SAM-dependent methyltransferase [Acidimicrobiales bacterium]RZV46307.1 MAG: class I SAM-dependent methyltransferase [Acidimicrobiales bacterium]
MVSDQQRWNDRYDDATASTTVSPPAALLEMAQFLPSTGRAVDLAGGLGDTALWLAQRGLDATLVEVSDVACTIADERARLSELELDTVHHDLTTESIPGDNWDVITCFHYLDRPVLRSISDSLRTGGIALVGIATITNLERHERPSARFLLEPNELPELLDGLEVIMHTEDWAPWGYHEARVAARKPR